ncbi:MAG: hypothetical protein ABIN05_04910 [candidate division WOR-3 bacterium]
MENYFFESNIEYHKTLSGHLRSIDNDSREIFGTLIVQGILNLFGNKTLGQTVTGFLSILVTYFAILLLTAKSYNYRQLILVLNRLEKKLCLSTVTPDWNYKEGGIFDFHPEFQKMQVLCLIILDLFFSALTALKSTHNFLVIYLLIVINVVFYLFLVFLIKSYWIKLTKRNDEIEEKQKQILNTKDKAENGACENENKTRDENKTGDGA